MEYPIQNYKYLHNTTPSANKFKINYNTYKENLYEEYKELQKIQEKYVQEYKKQYKLEKQELYECIFFIGEQYKRYKIQKEKYKNELEQCIEYCLKYIHEIKELKNKKTRLNLLHIKQMTELNNLYLNQKNKNIAKLKKLYVNQQKKKIIHIF
jgi:hypothetical protein